ncbi:MAG: FecR domain-containing protein [Bacteroidia bacterium]|nr:FecR domain-containing protein [Bacteroidia bacterium]
MEYNLDNIDDLIARVLAEEASETEKLALQSWINQSGENKTYFESSKEIFLQIDSLKTLHRVDTVKAWDKLNARIESEKEAKVVPLFSRGFLRVAASVVLLASLAVLTVFVLRNNGEEPVMMASTTTSVKQQLPDGSAVVLNKNSELSYQLNKFGTREVKLKGEAYFDVVHNEKEPFIISIGSIVIKDVGTSFNVKAIEGTDTIEVYVESGEVQFYYRNNENSGLKLVKGEKAIYKRSRGEFIKLLPDVNENIASYKSRIFRFKGARLKDVVEQINSVYGSDIQLSNEAIGKCRLSVYFDQEDLEVIISVIAETLDLQVERSGNSVLLKGEPCTDQ